MLRRCLLGVLLAAAAVCIARADADDRPAHEQRPQDQGAIVNAKQAIGVDEVDGPTIFEGVPALNGVDAIRDNLRDRYGFYFHGDYLGETYGDLSGGLRRGTVYNGRLDVQLDIDPKKTVGLPGGTLHANMFQIHGGDLSRDYIGNFLSSNDVAGVPTTRLYELWYEQKFGDKLSIRVGQQGIDVEFITSSYAANFIDATFGWPGLVSQNLPDGGASYPLAAPAVRVKYDATRNVSILAALFDGAPAGPCAGEPEQDCDRYGVNFRTSDPPLAMLEAHLRYNQGDNATGLPGRVKLGAFEHFGTYNDQRYGADDLNVKLRLNSILYAPDGGVYGIIDQQLYRLPGDDEKAGGANETAGDADEDKAERGIGAFARVIGAPSTRNPVDLYVDGGLSALGLIQGRPNDLVGVAAALAKMSSPTVGLNQSLGVPLPPRSFEAVIEATYQAEIVPGLTLQPTFQYIIHPSGNVLNPFGSGLNPIRNAVVAGVTTEIKF